MHRTRYRAFCLGAGAAVILALAKMPLSAAGESVVMRATPVSVSTAERQRRTHDLGRESGGTSIYELAFLLNCLGALSAQRTSEAIRDCSEAIRLNPNNPSGYKLRGMAHYYEGTYQSALFDLDSAVGLDPKDPEIFAARGGVFRANGQPDRALDDDSTAIALEPSNARWWNARCWTRAATGTRLQMALSDCGQALRLDSTYVEAFDSRGLIYLRLHDYREAARDYSRAIRIRPRLATALFGRGVARLRQGDIRGGADIERARSIDPSIDGTFAGYGISARGLAWPAQPPSAPGHCAKVGCRPVPGARSKHNGPKPPAPNEAIPARSAHLDVHRGTVVATP